MSQQTTSPSPDQNTQAHSPEQESHLNNLPSDNDQQEFDVAAHVEKMDCYEKRAMEVFEKIEDGLVRHWCAAYAEKVCGNPLLVRYARKILTANTAEQIDILEAHRRSLDGTLLSKVRSLWERSQRGGIIGSIGEQVP